MIKRSELDDLIQDLYAKRQIALQELNSYEDYQPDDVADIEFVSREVDILTGAIQVIVWSLPEYRFDQCSEPPWPWCKRVPAVSFFEARELGLAALGGSDTGRSEVWRELACMRKAR